MKLSLQKIITPNIFVATLTFVATIGCWILFYCLHPFFDNVQYRSIPAEIGRFYAISPLLANLLSLFIALLISLLIAHINHRHTYINTRTFLGTFIFLQISTGLAITHSDFISYLSTLLIVFSIHLLLNNYDNKNGVEIVFLSFIFLGTSIFLVPEYILFIPFVWIALYQIKSISPRIFFASVIGFIVPWLFIYLCHFLETNSFNYSPDFIFVFNNLSLMYLYDISLFTYLLAMGIILLFVIFGMYSRMGRESVKTRRTLHFFQVMGVGLLLQLIFFSQSIIAFLPLGAAIYALLGSYTFTHRHSLFYVILFIILSFVGFIFSIYQLLFY